MPLEELNDAVYKRDFKAKPLPTTDPVVAPGPAPLHVHTTPSVSTWADTETKPLSAAELVVQEKGKLTHRRRLALLLAAVLLFLLAVGGFFGGRAFLFDPGKVTLELTGPEIVKTGEELTLTFTYNNQNWAGLSDTELIVSFPESFRPKEEAGWEKALTRATYVIPVIPGQASGRVTFSGTLQAFDKKTAFFKATLRSSPKGITNPTEINSQWTVVVDTSAVQLDIVGPPSLVLGQPFEYIVKYHNESSETIENLRLVVEYPEGFTPTSLIPRPSRDENTWILNRLEPRSKGEISIRGEIRGNAGDARRLLARVGKELGDGSFLSLAQEEKTTRVLSPPIVVSLLMNNNNSVPVAPGGSLSGRVIFQNNSQVGIRDIIATVTIDETLIDVSKVSVPSGVDYNRSKQQFIFKASEIPSLRSLEPNERGELNFALQVRSDLATLARKNIEVKTSVSLDSPDLPHGQNTEALIPRSESIVKVSSPSSVAFSGAYTDLEFPNTGPLPPRVGELTTYTMRLVATTDINTLQEARWVAAFPGTVEFLGVLRGGEQSLQHNPRTGELVWEAGTIEPGAGRGKEIVFRLGFTPPANALGRTENLVSSGMFTAIDSFTGAKVELSTQNKASEVVVNP